MSKADPDLINSQSAAPGSSLSDRFTRQEHFPTLIFQYEVEDSEHLNKTLLDLCYAERERSMADDRSSAAQFGSWRSPTNLHKNPAYEPLLKEVNVALGRVSVDLNYAEDHLLKVTSMWSIIKSPGIGNRAQVRPNRLWGGCYFIQAPEASGNVKFVDPRTIVIMKEPKYEKARVTPPACRTYASYKATPGQMLIFPAWLYHGLGDNLSKENGREGDRVLIAFTINQVKKVG